MDVNVHASCTTICICSLCSLLTTEVGFACFGVCTCTGVFELSRQGHTFVMPCNCSAYITENFSTIVVTQIWCICGVIDFKQYGLFLPM